MARVKAAIVSQLAPGQCMTVEAGDKTICLANVDGTFYAIDDTCTHVGGPLSEGDLDGDCIECPWHGARFNVKTGQFIEGPDASDVPSYPVTIEGEDVFIDIG